MNYLGMDKYLSLNISKTHETFTTRPTLTSLYLMTNDTASKHKIPKSSKVGKTNGSSPFPTPWQRDGLLRGTQVLGPGSEASGVGTGLSGQEFIWN